MVPGRLPLEASIVSSEGLRLVLSVAVDLGQYVPEARLQSNLTILMRKLIERIEGNAASENPAAQRMLGDAPVSGKPKQVANRPDLNNDQFKALQSALGRNLTFIWGPPGTGKTRTIGTITEQLYKENRSVLIVSHTNTAVDQAVKHVARSIGGESREIKEGVLLRLGESGDKQLKDEFPDVLLKTQVERRSKELVEKREQLEAERQALSEQLNPIENDIAILEWVTSAKTDIDVAQKRLKILNDKESELSRLERKLSSLSEKRPELIRLNQLAQQVIASQETLHEEERTIAELRHQIEQLTTHTSTLARQVREHEKRVEIAHRISPLRKELSQYAPADEQNRNVTSLKENLNSLRKNLVLKQTELAAAQTLLDQTKNTGAMMRLWKRLPKPEDQQAVVNRISQEAADLQAGVSSHSKRIQECLVILNRTTELCGLLSPHQDIGDYFVELEHFKELSKKLDHSKEKLNSLSSKLSSQEKENQQLRSRIRTLTSQLGGSPTSTLTRTSEKLAEIDALSTQTKAVQNDAMSIRHELTSSLVHMVECLSAWGLLSEKSSGVEQMFQAVVEVHSNTAAKYRGVNLTELQQKASSIRSVISDILAQVSRIDQELSQVEKTVIAEASIIGATLTKAYLSDDIQSRKFDTVILDEASMAPIPALWVAALLADKNLVIVGDFLQLPPIVLSKNELTKKWLGRDIFEVSGMRAKWETHQLPSNFVPLTEQFRMLPQITDIANIFYGNLLKPPKVPLGKVQQERERWQQWYNTEWPHDSEVLLVDTGSLNAWVTSVVKNGNTSRLNFLSATVAVDLAEQLLRPDRPPREEGDPNRILIVSPYRAHAKLVSVLLRENKTIQDDVIAGTAHSFQGSEADVVIFDLVADEPHFRVNLFIPDLDDQLKGLLNVSLTRAKYRLIIIGDFEYCQSHAKKAFLGRELLPFLIKKYPKLDALSLVPNGLAARAAKAQMTMLGGAIEPNSDRIVVTQADFFRVLSADFERATSRIVIYSPFMTQDRVSFLLPQLQAAASCGVNIYVVTKAHSERSRADLQQYRKLEFLLSDIGAVVIHKLMCER